MRQKQSTKATLVYTFAWTTFRTIRRWGMTIVRKNPVIRGSAAPSFSSEWKSVRGLLRARNNHLARDVAESARQRWSTSLGPLWTPAGASDHYLQMIVAEMQSNVYDLSGLRVGAVVLDCGANVGAFTRWAVQKGASRIICFEPSPANTECLQLNLANEIASGQVVVIQKGVWDCDACLSFSADNLSNPGGHYISEDGKRNIQVQVTTIDAVCRELNLQKVDYVKLDVEGAELRALAGARGVISRDRPQLCIASEHNEDLFANAEAVRAAVQEIDPSYRMRVTEAHPYRSASRGYVLTPYTMLFQ